MRTTSKQRQASKNGKLEFRRPKNKDVRPREYLTDDEVDRLMKAAAKTGRHRHRDSTLILVTYRHGFRVAELTALRWDQVELDSGRMHVSRIKKGTPSVHPIRGPEIRALRRLKRDYPESPYVFVTERKGPLTNSAVGKMIARAGEKAGFDFQSIRTCFVTRPATSSLTMAMTPEPSSSILATRTSSTRFATPSWHPPASEISGKIRRLGRTGKAQMALHCAFASLGPRNAHQGEKNFCAASKGNPMPIRNQSNGDLKAIAIFERHLAVVFFRGESRFRG